MRNLAAGLFLLLLGGAARAEHIVHARIDRDLAEYTVHDDLTYEMRRTSDHTLLTRRGMQGLDRDSDTFYPDKQDVRVVEAWVDQPDGSRVVVPESAIFTRPSAAAQGAPGFVNSLTTTVLFPQLREGSKTHIVWKVVQKTVPLLGFNVLNEASFNWDAVLDETRITMPAAVKLRWGKRGDVTVSDTTKDGVRTVVATMPPVEGQEAELASVSAIDFQPLFVATTLKGYADVGAIVHARSAGKAEVTPEIAALAARIAGERTGLAAARAIHAWVVANIRYVAVYLDLDDGMIPHSAMEVLRAGYGDCKDYVVLSQALLAARGIKAEMAMVEWGNQFADLPIEAPYFYNHAILYLPEFDHFENPTDRYAPFDALDRQLSGKITVLATAEGTVMRTPASTQAANRYRIINDDTLLTDGTVVGTTRYEMAPNAEVLARNVMASMSSLEQLTERLLLRTAEGGFGRIEGSDPRDLLHPLTLSATWRSPHAVNTQGNSVFLRVPAGPDFDLPVLQRSKLSPDGHRRLPMLAEATDDGWDSRIALPSGWRVTQLPDDVNLSTSAGHYTAHYAAGPGAVTVSRNLVIAQDVLPAADYPELERLLYATLVDARGVLVLSPGDDAMGAAGTASK